MKTPKDRAVYKFMMLGTTAIIAGSLAGAACLALGVGKKGKRS
jgi:hypothetical protein